MNSIKKARKRYKSFMAMILAILTTLSVMPAVDVTGQSMPANTDYFTAIIMGKETVIPADGFVTVEVEGYGYAIIEVPRYINVDGQRVSIDDERIVNVSPVIIFSETGAFGSSRARAGNPTATIVAMVDDRFKVDTSVRMVRNSDGRTDRISSRRYFVTINNVQYEGFCVDPNLPGPSNNAPYALVGQADARFLPILRFDLPIPKVNFETIVCEPSDMQKEMVRDLSERASLSLRKIAENLAPVSVWIY